MRISFVGGGTMGEAMIAGILESGLAPASDVTVGEPLETRRDHLAAKYGIGTGSRNLDAIDGADLVVLSVKPQNLAEALAELDSGLGPGQTAVSIIAGATLDTLRQGLGHGAIIRVMPNTPAQIGAGMSVWTATPEVGAEGVDATRRILRTLGEELYVDDEKLIDVATALSASGPAYVFLFIESLIDAGVYLGMARDAARRLAVQMVLGSARLVDESGRHPAELKDMVTSPGGTTAEALMSFEQAGFRGSVLSAVKAAYDRSVSLGRQG